MTNHQKIAGYEKQIIKGLIAMCEAKGIELNANHIEYDLMGITDNRNTNHREAVEKYIETLISK